MKFEADTRETSGSKGSFDISLSDGSAASAEHIFMALYSLTRDGYSPKRKIKERGALQPDTSSM
jgi:hypothetical protein